MRVGIKLFLIFFFICLGTFFVFRSFRLQTGYLDRMGSQCIQPFLLLHHKFIAPVEQRYRFWRESKQNLQQLIQEKESLLLQCQNLQAENIELQGASYLNKSIKELREFRDRCYPKDGKIVQVVVKNFSPSEHSFLIGAGEREGVRPDMVVVHKNCLVGRVVEVLPYYSKVALITDKGCTVAGYCFKTRTTGIYNGTSSDRARFDFVNHLQKIKEGDRIISSGQGVIYPQGLGLGTVEKVIPKGVSYEIIVKPLVDLSGIDYCILMQK
ncbi:rod shape-determining protein MreC [bacterium]|nr:rod shape-determining protein MreC [bacterium]MBT5014842.1 rod shape-determining protein MreC [bacterium]